MQELKELDTREGPTAVGTDLDSVRQRMVTVVCGTKEVTDTFVGKTVAHIRQELGTMLQIPQGAVAIMDGGEIPKGEEQSTLVHPGDLEFVKHTGPKG